MKKDVLSTALGDAVLDGFFSHNWGKLPLHLSGVADWSESLLGFDKLDELLQHHQLEWPQLRMVKNGVGIPETNYTKKVPPRVGSYEARTVLTSSAVENELLNGATLVLDGLDRMDLAIRRIVAALERKLNCHGSANLYLTCGENSQGFDLHWDDHDVIVLQIAGNKSWSILEPTRSNPLWLDTDVAPLPDASMAEELKLELSPGDFLYVPHGWWHEAQGQGQYSLHLTIGLKRPNGTDYLKWLSDSLREHDLVRAPVPVDKVDFDRWRMGLVELFEHQISDKGSCSNFFAEIGSLETTRPNFGIGKMFENKLSIDDTVWLVGSRVKMLLSGDDTVALVANGMKWNFPKELKNSLEELIKGQPLKIGEWVKIGFDESDSLNLISELLENGILTRKEP